MCKLLGGFFGLLETLWVNVICKGLFHYVLKYLTVSQCPMRIARFVILIAKTNGATIVMITVKHTAAVATNGDLNLSRHSKYLKKNQKIKLYIYCIGEGRLKENDEYLTDLVTVFFGLGIFNANASFKYFSNQDSWGYHKQGYLMQQEWGYGLALYAYIRNETDPAWISFLTPNIKSNFKKSISYLLENTDKVLC